MLAIAAAIIFAIAFIIRVPRTATDVVFAPTACCWRAWPSWPCIRRAYGR